MDFLTNITTIPKKELLVLHNEARKVDGTIVDIGTANGGSAFTMALASPKSTVWTIDPSVGPLFFSERERLGLEERVRLIAKTSNEASNNWNKRIDLLFIDGLHTLRGIIDDINNWAPFTDGHILLHDYYWYGDLVQRAIDKASVRLEILDIPFGLHSGKPVGIAITRRI